LHPKWSDEQLYQEARKLNIATEEMITYNEYLPAILGPNALAAYAGYQSNVNASIATEFSTVGFRFGHSMLDGEVGRNNNDGTDIADPTGNADVNLAQDFFDPNLISATASVDPLTGHATSNIGAILKSSADGDANETDLLLVDEVRNVLFGIPNGPGTDLAARDIQRARDDGIGTYNQVRVAFGLAPVSSFADITGNRAVQQELQSTYGTVDQIDPFEGMLAEDHVTGGDVGPTIQAILAKQFAALRDGDRFFYLNENLTTQENNIINQASTLSRVITKNTEISNLQRNVFSFTASISGTVFNDQNGNGVRDRGESGVSGVTVNLLDDSGGIVATTTTDNRGRYQFTDQSGIPGTGNFSVAIVLPSGFTNTTPTSVAVSVNRGGLTIGGTSFGVEKSSAGATGLSAVVSSPQTATSAPTATDPAPATAATTSAAAPDNAAASTGGTMQPAESGGADTASVDQFLANVL
jgi:hypothetical protein